MGTFHVYAFAEQYAGEQTMKMTHRWFTRCREYSMYFHSRNDNARRSVSTFGIQTERNKWSYTLWCVALRERTVFATMWMLRGLKILRNWQRVKVDEKKRLEKRNDGIGEEKLGISNFRWYHEIANYFFSDTRLYETSKDVIFKKLIIIK